MRHCFAVAIRFSSFSGRSVSLEIHQSVETHRCKQQCASEFSLRLSVVTLKSLQESSSEELFHKVWKEECYKNSNNTVMVHIRHLREKMNGPTGKSDFIKTVWGVGYKVEE